MTAGKAVPFSLWRFSILNASLHWRETTRNRGAIRGSVTRLLAVVGKLYLLLNCAVIGYVLDLLVKPFSADADTVAVVERHIPGVFLALSIVRFSFSNMPFIVVRPFLLLPVGRSRVAIVFLCRMLGGSLSVAPVVAAATFSLKNIALAHSMIGGLLWLTGIACLNCTCVALLIPAKHVLSKFQPGVVVLLCFFLAVLLSVVSGAAMSVSSWLGTMFFRLRSADLLVCGGWIVTAVVVWASVFPFINRCMDVDSV